MRKAILILIMVSVLSVIGALIVVYTPKSPDEAPKFHPSYRHVRYEVVVSGADVLVSYLSDTGVHESKPVGRGTWTQEEIMRSGDRVELSAVGVATVNVYLDDKLVMTKTATTEYGVAEVSGRLE